MNDYELDVRHALHWPKAFAALMPLQTETGGLGAAGVVGAFAGGLATGFAGAAGGFAAPTFARALHTDRRC